MAKQPLQALKLHRQAQVHRAALDVDDAATGFDGVTGGHRDAVAISKQGDRDPLDIIGMGTDAQHPAGQMAQAIAHDRCGHFLVVSGRSADDRARGVQRQGHRLCFHPVQEGKANGFGLFGGRCQHYGDTLSLRQPLGVTLRVPSAIALAVSGSTYITGRALGAGQNSGGGRTRLGEELPGAGLGIRRQLRNERLTLMR